MEASHLFQELHILLVFSDDICLENEYGEASHRIPCLQIFDAGIARQMHVVQGPKTEIKRPERDLCFSCLVPHSVAGVFLSSRFILLSLIHVLDDLVSLTG